MNLLSIDPGPDMSTIRFTVPAVPVAQPRPRATIAHGGKGARMHEVTSIKNQNTGERRPHPIAAFKATVRLAAESVLTGSPLDGPLRVDMVFVFPRQSAKVWKSKPMPRYPHVSKPDRDNLAKSTQDALNGLAWVDDSQICAGEIQKWHASGDEHAHVEIIIQALATKDLQA